MKRALDGLITAAAWLVVAAPAAAQTTSDGIAKYREMIADGNPAELYEAKGEALWKQAAGPKQATLERCDLGLGPGVVKGAYARLPRYFADTDRVQDVESRLMTCMQTLQGFDPAELVNTPFGQGRKADLVALATFVSGESKGVKVDVQPRHPKEREMLALGRRAFFMLLLALVALVALVAFVASWCGPGRRPAS